MTKHNQIDLIEFPAASVEELAANKKFFTQVFDWTFQDWGEDYASSNDSGVISGIISDEGGRPTMPLAVIYVEDLEAAHEKVVAAGGTIIKETYPFPGGRRFHFKDPAGNELAVWSE